MNQIEIGKFIASLRKEQNLTQRNLAEMLGITDRAISKWENGRGLPDVLLMKKLCAIFNISIDELLNAKRVDDVNTDEGDSNVLNVLLERELEFRKRKRLQTVCSILLVIIILFGFVFGIISVNKIVSCIRGEGSTFYTDIYTRKADLISHYIIDENFEKAVKYIGFLGQEKEKAQEEWIQNMENLVEIVDLEAIDIFEIILDDNFPLGKYYITVYDRESAARYVFYGQITIQDKGIAFGSIYISAESADFRRNEVAEFINDALGTWNAG